MDCKSRKLTAANEFYLTRYSPSYEELLKYPRSLKWYTVYGAIFYCQSIIEDPKWNKMLCMG